MKKRYLYTLLFLFPGVLISLLAAMLATGAAAGFFWIFVFGDDSWPAAAGNGIVAIFTVFLVGGWLVSLWLGYRTGKRLEVEPGLNRKHLLVSFVMTLLPLLMIVLHQLGMGNLGKKHDSVICSEYCLDQGYSASGMPPKNSGDDSCICYDSSGNEAVKTQMETLFSQGQ